VLSGFVYVPARLVGTRYWLKIDTDAIALGLNDWIDEGWFRGAPAIVGHKWGFTRPGDQMLRLDKWVEHFSELLPNLACRPALNLVPNEGEDRVCHPRIESWCAFFDTDFTQNCAECAASTVGYGRLPVPSQDGFLWYCATRSGRNVERVAMKNYGWAYWSTYRNVKLHAEEALRG
jgi:hypothetical protein